MKQEGNIDWSPLICAAMLGDQTHNPDVCPGLKNPTHNLLVYRTTLQPTKPHQLGHDIILFNNNGGSKKILEQCLQNSEVK